MQTYFDPARKEEPYALPDCEVFYHDGVRYSDDDVWADSDGEPMPAGWYYWACFPGCMPDSDPTGPFDTAKEAEADAQNQD